MRIAAGRAQRRRVEIGLADDDGAERAEAGDDGGAGHGGADAQSASARGEFTRDINVVLERDRYAEQRCARAAAHGFDGTQGLRVENPGVDVPRGIVGMGAPDRVRDRVADALRGAPGAAEKFGDGTESGHTPDI